MKDLLSFGEAMIRLSPPGHQKMEQATLFEAHVGGTELNVAIGSARLGLKNGYITRLPKNSLGNLVHNRIREHGLDTERIQWSEKDRLGLYFVEAGTNPRGGDLIYDRAHSAISRIDPASLDWDPFFRITGISTSRGLPRPSARRPPKRPVTPWPRPKKPASL